MSRLSNNRFTKILSAALSFSAVIAVGYGLTGESRTAFAAGRQSTEHISVGQSEKNQSEKNQKAERDFPDGVDEKAVEEQLLPPKKERPETSSDRFEDYNATAYCLTGRTASGHATRRGMIAADVRLLPIGTVVEIRAKGYSGIYTVMDTGPSIKGKKIDVFVPTYQEARQFGRQQVKLAVISRPTSKASSRSVTASTR